MVPAVSTEIKEISMPMPAFTGFVRCGTPIIAIRSVLISRSIAMTGGGKKNGLAIRTLNQIAVMAVRLNPSPATFI